MLRRNHLTSGIFYYWNDDLSPERIKRDLRSMAEAGFQYVFLHPMPDKFNKQNYFCGMKAPYLGRRFMTLARVMVAECRKNHLAMMLYDEGGWPSGSVLNTLVRKYPECRVRSYARNAAGELQIQEEDIPDLLRAETTRRFIEMTHEKYFRALGGEFGKTIRAIFTDEPFWTGQTGWEMVRCNEEISRAFQQKYGLSFEKEVVPLIFEGSAGQPGAKEARGRYLEICSELFAKNYSAELSRWCRSHHIALMGHLDSEDTYFVSGNRCGELIQRMDPFQVPGVDVVFRQHYPGCDRSYIARFAVAAAIRNRRHEVIAECFNVYGYGLIPSAMNWIAASLMARGVNQIAAMPFLSSDFGKHKICCSTDISPRNPLWDAMPALTRFWNWCGNFNAGVLTPKVWLFIRLNHADVERNQPDAVHLAIEAKALETIRELERRQVFFRLADFSDLDRKERPELLILLEEEEELAGKIRSLPCRVTTGIPDDIDRYAEVRETSSSGCVTLPCRRPEGDALMVFNPGDSACEFSFRSSYSWGEIMPPDPVFSRFAPLVQKDGVWLLPMPPGGTRILLRDGSAGTAETYEKVSLLTPVFTVTKVEHLIYSLRRETTFRSKKERRKLPPSGMFTDLEPDFSGRFFLETEIKADQAGEYWLSFEKIDHYARVLVNGHFCGERAFAPWLFRVKLKQGKNHLQIVVSSSAGNAYRRFFKEKMKPAGWYNVLTGLISRFVIDDARCGIGEKITLYRIKEKQ